MKIQLNKEEYNKVMKLTHAIKDYTKGTKGLNTFIDMYEEMHKITADTCAIDELVWGNYHANEYFESHYNRLYERYVQAIDFICYWCYEWRNAYEEIKKIKWQDKEWIIEYFEEFTILEI